MNRVEELPQDRSAGNGQPARTLEPQLAGKFVEVPAQDGDGIGEAGEPGIPADFAHDAKDADGAELLEDVGVAQEGGFDGIGLVLGLMLPDNAEDGRDFGLGKSNISKDLGGSVAGIGHMIPAGESCGVFGAMAHKDTKVMEPGCGGQDVSIVVDSGADGVHEGDQTGLVPEFVDRTCLRFDELGQPKDGIGSHETFVTFWTLLCSREFQNGAQFCSSRPFGTQPVTFLWKPGWDSNRVHLPRLVASCTCVEMANSRSEGPLAVCIPDWRKLLYRAYKSQRQSAALSGFSSEPPGTNRF